MGELHIILWHTSYNIMCVIELVCFMQVTVEYKVINGAYVPQRVHTIVISVHHSKEILLEDLRKEISEKVIKVSLFKENVIIRRTSLNKTAKLTVIDLLM